MESCPGERGIGGRRRDREQTGRRKERDRQEAGDKENLEERCN